MDNNNFTSKAGEYIGQALLSNPNYPLKVLSFHNINIESIGLTRLIEAVNGNSNIKRLDIGVLTNEGLTHVASILAPNQSLEELTIEETDDP